MADREQMTGIKGREAAIPDPDGPSRRRAAMGRMVREQLARSPHVGSFGSDWVEAYYHYDFLAADECAVLIAEIDANCRRSEVVSQQGTISDFRTSCSGDLDRHDPLVMDIEDRICRLMGLHPRQGETMQGQRYTEGQEFGLHHDYFSLAHGYWPKDMQTGGQRIWTAMIYLDAPERGGTTLFRDAGFAIPTVPGLLVMWNNMKDDGSPNPGSLHAGTPVEAGVKHVITKWFREGYWI